MLVTDCRQLASGGLLLDFFQRSLEAGFWSLGTGEWLPVTSDNAEPPKTNNQRPETSGR
jgi:hypothetical protein